MSDQRRSTPPLRRRQGYVGATALLVVALCACSRGDGARDTGVPAAAPLITLDTHADIPLDFATPAVDPLNANLQVNLEKMARGGLDAAFFIVYVPQSARTGANYARAQNDAQQKFAAIHRMADELYPSRIEIAYHADDEPIISEDQVKELSGWGLTPKGLVVYFDFPHVIAYFDKNDVPYSVVKQFLKPNGPTARFQ